MNVTERNLGLTQLEKAVYGSITSVLGIAGMLLTSFVAVRFYQAQRSSFAIIVLHLGASDGIGLFMFSTYITTLIVGDYDLLRDLSPSTTLLARCLQYIMSSSFYVSLFTTVLMALNRYSAVVSGPRHKEYFSNQRLMMYFIFVHIGGAGIGILIVTCGALFDCAYMTFTYHSCQSFLYPAVFTFDATVCGVVFVLNMVTLYKVKTYRETRQSDRRANQSARKENRFFYATLFNCIALEVILIGFFIISPHCGTNRACNYFASATTYETGYYTNAIALVVVARDSLRKRKGVDKWFTRLEMGGTDSRVALKFRR